MSKRKTTPPLEKTLTNRPEHYWFIASLTFMAIAFSGAVLITVCR